MATMYEVGCRKCGFKSEVGIGGGRGNYLTFATWPVYCEDCHDLRQANLLAPEIRCFTCNSVRVTRYGQPPLSVPTGKPFQVEWGGVNMDREGHLCPKCGERAFVVGNITMMVD
jgi:hypothetical protein